jgi:GNAT superfamily N-acetyltransferase
MWHIISVKAFHAGGAEKNRTQLTQLALTENEPIGILAYRDSEPIGWCAVGPRNRYARAIKTPTYRQKTEDIYSNIWLVPCFFVRSDARGLGLSKLLLEAAVQLANKHNAEAIDGFPFTSEKPRFSSQIHVGFESTFLACGFEPIRKPSQSRVVMRRILHT